MNGTRREDNCSGLKEGEYCRRLIEGVWEWHGNAPGNHGCNLSRHKVEEHEDRTITVSPSILIFYTHPDTNQRVELWHGYLEHGVWRSC
jgi:hypothetical protein